MDLEHLRATVWPFLEEHYGLPAGLLDAIASVETGGTYNPRAYNPNSRASGLFQLTPIALEQLRRDTMIEFDPMSAGASSTAAAILMRRHLKMFGNLTLALAAYNAGEGTVRRFIADARASGRGRLPKETVRYIPKVLGAM